MILLNLFKPHVIKINRNYYVRKLSFPWFVYMGYDRTKWYFDKNLAYKFGSIENAEEHFDLIK